MVQIPALIAFQHGAEGMAALLVSLVGLVYRADSARGVAEVSGIFGLVLPLTDIRFADSIKGHRERLK